MQRLRGSTALLAAYVVVVLLATQLPFVPDPVPGSLGERLARAWNPTVSGRDAVDALRNLVLFAGWGLVWVMTRPARVRRTGEAPTYDAPAAVVGALLTGLALSVAVELFQLFSAQRTASILDVATNSAGAFAGAVGLVGLERFARARRGKPSYVGIPALLLALGYGAAVVLESFSPLMRQERIPGLWGSAGERLGAALERSALGASELGFLDLFLFAPAGILAVLAMAELGVKRSVAAMIATVLALPAFILAEIAHGAMGLPILWAPPLAHTAAVFVGAVVCAWSLPSLTKALRGRYRPLFLYTLYALLLPMWSWRPFSPAPLALIREKLGSLGLIPLAAYRERMDVFTAVDVMIPVFILVPVGALLAVWPLRQRGALSGILPGLWAAAFLEAMQILFAERYFDITDVLIQAAALLVGWWVARLAGYAPYGEAIPRAVQR